MSKISAKVWPYSIGASIILVFGFCVATVFVVESANIQESNEYMTNYQTAENDANDYINKRIAFDKKYKISYVNRGIDKKNPLIRYDVKTLDSAPVMNAKIKILVSRPETHVYDQKLSSPRFEDGFYTFDGVEFAKAGKWDIIAKVEVGKYSRFYNIKIDTRNKYLKEY